LNSHHFSLTLSQKKKKKKQCLSSAAYNDQLEVVKYLLEEGKVDADCKDFGTPPLFPAAETGNTKLIEYLLSVRANINMKREGTNWNALHYAVHYGEFKAVKLLVSKGCDFNAKDKKGKTPLLLAEEKQKQQIVAFLTGIIQKYVLFVYSLLFIYFFFLPFFLFVYFILFFFGFFFRYGRMKKGMRICRMLSNIKSDRQRVLFKLIVTVFFRLKKKKTI
jgi:hypothetical protein